MTEWSAYIYGGVEEALAVTQIFVIYLFIKIFVHETTNFYSRISALLLCAGATLIIGRLAIDGY